MDIRQLHYFLTLCEEMNYTRAAQRLFLSRQALRQSISALEAELCGPLFLSAHHKLTLTDRGMSLQRHAAPVVEQFQQMQAALRAEIQSAQPVRIGISVALVPDYLPGLETQLDKFRQQYPHVEMRFRLLDNDAVADGVEQGELDAGLVIDLGCAAPVLARTTLRADPACLLVPRGHPFWEKERIPLAELRGQRVLLPSLRQDLFSPLWAACARAGFAPNAEIGPSFYQAYYLVQEQLCTCLTRYEPGARRELDRVRDVLLEDMPPLCVSLVQRRDTSSAYIDLLRSYLMEVLGGAVSLPPRRGRSAKPFYNLPVLSSAAAKPAVVHPAPGTQLPFEGGHNFRELGGYEADEGKHIKWGQIYRGIPTWKLTSEADRKLLDSLGGADLCVGGIGINGHLAFNEPKKEMSTAEFSAITARVLEISPETRTANAIGDLNGAIEDMPRYAITIGMHEILGAKRVRIGVFRQWHRAVVRRAACGEAGSQFPASLLQNHPDAMILANDVASERAV